MATEGTSSRNRWIAGSTLGAGVALVLALFVMVNYLALRHYKRFDWTRDKIYSLSEKSLAVVRGVDREVDLVAVLAPDSPIYGPVTELLSSYAAANPKLRKREVDPAKNLIEAQRLVERYAIDRDNVVIVASGDDRRVIGEFELAEYDYSGTQFGQPPTMSEFKGEQLITSAILALIEAEKPRVLFTTGHGEAALERGSLRSLSQARDLLGGDNFEIETWSPLGKNAVPEGTDLVVIAGPTTNFLPPELEVLSAYLDAGGRLLVLLDPVFAEGSSRPVDLGLGDWLRGYGVEIRADVVVDPSSELPFFGPETIFTDAYGSHPIVEALDQRRTRVLMPLARSVSRSGDVPAGVEVAELVKTSDAGWGETDLEALDQVAPGEGDVEGPVTLAVAVSFRPSASAADEGDGNETATAESAGEGAEEAEEGEGEEAGEDAEGGEDGDAAGDAAGDGAPEARLVVFGDFDFASDAQIANGDNAVLLLNALNWLVKREELIDIEARKPEQTTLAMSTGELQQVYLLVLGILPGLAIAFGVWVYLRRRR